MTWAFNAWSRAVQTQSDSIAREIEAERPTVAVLRAVLARGTDADLVWLARQTGGTAGGARSDLVRELATRARAIVERGGNS